MNKLSRPIPFTFVWVLLLIGVGAAAEESPRRTPQARGDFRGVASPLRTGCQICDLAYQKCFETCFTNAKKEKTGSCLTACNNAAATCTCDGAVTLRSEDLVEWGVVSIDKGWDGCHLPVNCQPNYPSCASWSGNSACGEPYCDYASHCGLHCEQGFCWPLGGPGYYVPYERFRVCFDEFQNSCTEWQNVATVSCDCGEGL